MRPAFTTSVRKTISRPPSTGRRKWACSEWSRLPAGASPHAALIVRARPMPPKTTGPNQSGVCPTHASPRALVLEQIEELVDRRLLLLARVHHVSARGTRVAASR